MRYRWDPAYPPGRRPGAATDATLRASDAERNEVADALSRHFAEGRLDAAEFKERLDRAMGATTRGDLVGLFDDLPRLAPETPPPPPARRRRRLVPFVLLFVLLAALVGSSFTIVHVPWLLVLIVAALLWHRSGGMRSRHRHHSHLRGHGDSPYEVIG